MLLRQVNDWRVDFSDGVCIGGKHFRYQLTQHRTMTNTELTLDQLTAIAGGKTHELDEFIEWIKRPWCFPLPTDNDWPGEWPGQDEKVQ